GGVVQPGPLKSEGGKGVLTQVEREDLCDLLLDVLDERRALGNVPLATLSHHEVVQLGVAVGRRDAIAVVLAREVVVDVAAAAAGEPADALEVVGANDRI